MEFLISTNLTERLIPVEFLATFFKISGVKSESLILFSSKVLTTAPTNLCEVLKGILYFLTNRLASSVVVEKLRIDLLKIFSLTINFLVNSEKIFNEVARISMESHSLGVSS